MADDIHDVFISYKREHVARARELRQLLWEKRWSVFLDENLHSGQRWDTQLQERLEKSRCVVTLWAQGSAASNVQFDEANYALSHGKLVLARLDDEELPLGLRPVQWIDLSTWNGTENNPGISVLFANIARTIAAFNAMPPPVGAIAKELVGQPDSADRHSVSNRSVDRDGIVTALPGADPVIIQAIREGYGELSKAHNEARLALDDAAPRKHYENAAKHFARVLLSLTQVQREYRPAGSSMPIAYFLNMELANAQVFAGSNSDPVPKSAFDIYEELAKKFEADTAVWLRLGRARVKSARYGAPGPAKRTELQSAIRDLNKALSVAPFDALVDPEHWVYFEAPLQIGICFWQIAEFPNLPAENRRDALDQALRHTKAVLERKLPAIDPDGFVHFITLRAAGNVLFYVSLLMREGETSDERRETVYRWSQYLTSAEAWPIVQNQVRILDSLMFSAVTVGDRKLAEHIATLNMSNFRKISLQRLLEPEEMAMAARAEETAFLLAAPSVKVPTAEGQ